MSIYQAIQYDKDRHTFCIVSTIQIDMHGISRRRSMRHTLDPEMCNRWSQEMHSTPRHDATQHSNIEWLGNLFEWNALWFAMSEKDTAAFWTSWVECWSVALEVVLVRVIMMVRHHRQKENSWGGSSTFLCLLFGYCHLFRVTFAIPSSAASFVVRNLPEAPNFAWGHFYGDTGFELPELCHFSSEVPLFRVDAKTNVCVNLRQVWRASWSSSFLWSLSSFTSTVLH